MDPVGFTFEAYDGYGRLRTTEAGKPVDSTGGLPLMDDNGPTAASILTYSLSENPNSPHRADQTRLFSDKGWVPGRFCQAQIDASPELTVERVSGRDGR